MQGPYLRKYGVASNVNFVLYGTSGKAFQTGASFASGDIKIMVDNGAEANSATGFADEGQGYSLPVTSSELTGQKIVIYAVDQGTKIWLDTNMVIETYGHPSAMHGFDLDSTEVDVGKIKGSSSDADDINALLTIIGKLPPNDLSGSTEIADLNNLSTTDIITQVNASTGVAGTFAAVNGLKDISSTDILTQSNASLVAFDLDHLSKIDKVGVAPTSGSLLDLIMSKTTDQTFSQATDSLEAIRDRGDAAWFTNVLTTTDLLTQGVIAVNSATDINTIIVAVQGLKDISTTDVLTQVNLSDASTFDPAVDKVNATLTYKKALDDLTAESYGQVFKTGNAYLYQSSTGGTLFTLTVKSSDRTRTS